jgi:predicted DCC family thiol-disulfide oxidoreductase YuxK
MGTNTEVDNVVFFDGVCNLCNASVNFLIARDPKAKFRFSSLQSEFSQGFLPFYGVNPAVVDSIAFFSEGRLYRRSRAALEIAKRMRNAWPICYVFIIIPGFLRDAIYNWIARNRYKWFGKEDACSIPTPDLKARFLDS